MYTLRLYHDTFEPGATTQQSLQAQHSNVYLFEGSATINGSPMEKDAAAYIRDSLHIGAGPNGAKVWRWEVTRASEPDNLATGEGVMSRLRMSRQIKMFELVPTSKWLFRLDSILENQGSTGLHSHPGSGIRCMIEGQIRIESDKGECADNRFPGDVWYEEGSYPLISTTDPGNKATFLRGMVLPPEYDRYPDTAIWIEGSKTCIAGWKNYVQAVITLI